MRRSSLSRKGLIAKVSYATIGGVKGSYVLLLRLNAEAEISVGRLGCFRFAAGLYAYCGSGLAGVDARVARHRRRDKKAHWHIDYLLRWVDLVGVWVFRSEEHLECRLASALTNLKDASVPVPGFGSSDCRCPSHLVALPRRLPEHPSGEARQQRYEQAIASIMGDCFASSSLSFEYEGEC